MKILLFGSTGQLGWELQRSLAPLGELVALGRGNRDSHLHADLAQPARLADTVRSVRPDVVVNAAAYTAVDQAEREAALARTVNAEAPGVLAEAAHAVGALMVHYSTDYVFDGSGSTPWREDDATGPLSVYGRTKLEGEQRVIAHCARHLVLRTSWVYAARGGNFAKTMLRLGQERDRLTVIDDQWGAPTGAELIADVTAHTIVHTSLQPAKGGIYHLAASGETTWHSYAKHVFAQAQQAQEAINIKAKEVLPIPTSQYPTPARRPHNSRLDCSRLQTVFGLKLPPWQQGVDRMLAEIL